MVESKINVTVRIKPLGPKDAKSDKSQSVWQKVSEQTLVNTRTKEAFTYDRVFGPEVHTETIFNQQVKELVHNALDGINQTVFAYGQTSSGKTFTMRGYQKGQQLGLIPLSVREIFETIQADQERDYQVTVSYIEIYNECVNDLITPANKNLDVRESIQGIYINKLTEKKVTDSQQVIEYMEQGDEVRNVAETRLNEASSRSHTVFRINIQSSPKNNKGGKIKVSQLNLVDLAGSEGVNKTHADGLRLREGSNINRSLLALSNVINKLSQGNGKTFINYRDSKMTRILQASLGGNSKTAIICTITQTLSNYQETVNTLHFGQKAKHVKTKVNVNEISQLNSSSQSIELEKANNLIADLQNRLKLFEAQMLAAQGVQIVRAPAARDEETKEGGDVQMADEQAVGPSETLNGEDLARGARPNETSSYTSKSALLQTQEISSQAMRDQIKFMSEKIEKAMYELEQKENLVQQIELEKREAYRKYEALEVQNFELQEKLTISQLEAETAKKEAKDALQTSLSLSQQITKEDRNRQLLEADGIKLLDNCEIMTGLGGNDDLRKSIGPTGDEVHAHLREQLNLLRELEKVKAERDEYRRSRDQLQRDILNQTFESNLEMKEENQMLREQDVIRNELLTRYEKRNEDMTKELEFYKEQNTELIKRLDEFETSCIMDAENISVNEPTDTQKMLKEQNAAQLETITNLKREIRELELYKAQQESQKAELVQHLRAAEYNVEIIKNELESIKTETALEKAQHEKTKKSFSYLKMAYQRLKGDQEHLNRKGRKSISRQQKSSQMTTPMQQQCGGPIGSARLNSSALLDISGLSSFTPIEGGAERGQAHFGPDSRMSVGGGCGATSDLGQSLMPYLTVEMRAAESQCELWNVAEIEAQESKIRELKAKLESQKAHIDELEKKLESVQRVSVDSDRVKKMKYDNHILQLSQYKKAEKNLKEIASDYEEMKMKYYNVLKDNEKQKTQLQELITGQFDKDVEIRDLKKERDRHIDELNRLGMDINKKIEILEEKDNTIEALTQRLQTSNERAQKILAQEREVSQLRSDIQTYMQMLQQVLKHLKTLQKYLHGQVQTTKDPTVIEQTNRQIRSIEKLSNEVKTSMKSQKSKKRGPSSTIDNFFMSANESAFENTHPKPRLSIESSEACGARPSISVVAQRKMHQRQQLALTARESIDAKILVDVKNTASAQKRMKTSAGNPMLNASQDDGWVSASGASIADTNREMMKTMVQTTDAEGGADENLNTLLHCKGQRSSGSKAQTKASQKLAAHSNKAILQHNILVENQQEQCDGQEEVHLPMDANSSQNAPQNNSKKPAKRRSGRAVQKAPQKMVGCLTEAEI